MQAQFPAASALIDRLESYDPFISSSVSLKTVVKQNEKSTLEIQSYYTGRKPEFVNEVTGTSMEEFDTEVGVNIMESLSLGSSNILRFGGLYNYWNAPNGKRFYAGRKSELQTISAVITDEQVLGKLNINGGVRWVKTYINEFGAFNIDGSGSAFRDVEPIRNQWQPYILQMTGGAVYDIGTHSKVSLNVVSGSVRPREGALNGDLSTPENEYRTMLDAGVKLSRRNYEGLVLTGFYVNQKNAIIYSGEVLALEDGRYAELYENQDQFQYGIEMEVKTPSVFRRTTRVFLNLTGMRSMVREGNETYENTELPELIANTGLNILLRDFDLNLYGNYSSEFFSTRFADKSVGPVSLGGYFRFDLNLGYTIGSKRNWRIYSSIKNLFDVKYSTVAGYPDPGRRFNVGLEYHFTRK
jgi:outer membrane receptor protein involved in Fe transport